ncbi:hypothetical protein [Kushneria phyllosphaerae]|uniref:General stress protein 17M-like domain-containing protein n=1 Tax=Kushneria phyllosphaerae TaxID=2100822 RepID=A0A2R8CI30_9GAMM|nr:hypothetical protein [Kushneria phyllosphaerae]SPJ32546.1 hypothetical protein KSP9073_00547 [Kushneria phyllosphaerae]
MEEQLVVAVYDTEANADAAMQDLRNAGIPESAINRHAQTEHDSAVSHEASEEEKKPSFWQRLFGKHDHSEDTSAYDRNVERGATVIAVRALVADLDRIEDILERHDPVDIDEKSVEHRDGEGLTGSMGAGTAPKVTSGHDNAHADPAMLADREAPLPLSEDDLVTGQHDGERSTPSRVRRHNVDAPWDDNDAPRDEPTGRDDPLDLNKR